MKGAAIDESTCDCQQHGNPASRAQAANVPRRVVAAGAWPKKAIVYVMKGHVLKLRRRAASQGKQPTV
jgi:hypothetical protein